LTEVLFLVGDVKNFIVNTKLDSYSQFTKILSFINLNFPKELVQKHLFQHLFS
jgi:hypothetical protein